MARGHRSSRRPPRSPPRSRSRSRSPSSDVERGYDTDDSRLDPGEVVRRKYRLMPYCCREFRDCMIATVIFWWAIGKLNENHPFLEWR